MAYSLEQLEHIYAQCLDLPQEQRAAYIIETCSNNPEMKEMLLRMLGHNQQAIAYFNQLQQTLARGMAEGAIPRFDTGEMLGNYRILSFLAKGGMSNVYMAERADGHFEQQVVVKTLPAKMMQEDVVQKAGEQQILAKLRHPNIATLYDAGITKDDVPYFVMEYIEGMPVDEYMEQRKLTTNQRLNVFTQVLEAVAYAHSHLILHLDLKPGNILVNKSGHVKLLDFGIATSITFPQEEGSGFLGTPKIAAPEQFASQLLTVATDVYQLGMLMHKLLTGSFPETETLVEQDDKISREALQKSVENRRISGELNFELAAILKKCLEVVPEKRYSGVGNLLDDVHNYLHRLPVTAIPLSYKYRVSKFLQRNRTVAIALMLIFFSLITGTAVSLWQAKEAKQQRDLALKNEQVSNATKNFLIDLFMAAHPSVNKGDTMTVFQFLDKGYEKADSYTGSPQIKLEMLTTIGKLYRTLGDFKKSAKSLEMAYKVAQDSKLQLSVSYIQAIEQLALYQRDKGNYDSAYIVMNQVLRMYSDSKYPEKDSIYTASLKYQSYICKQLEKTDSAILLISKAIVLEEQLWPKKDNINLAESYHVLGVIYKNQSKYEPSIKYLTKSLQLCESLMGTNFPGTMANLNALSGTLILAGDYKAALIHSKRATDIAIRLFGHDHKETATAIDNLGGVFLKLQSYDSAYYYYKSGLDIRQKIYPQQKNQHLLYSTNNLLSLFVEWPQADSAKKYLSQALTIGTSDKIHNKQRAYTYSLAGDYYQQLAKRDSAYYYYQKSITASKTYLPETDERIVLVKEKLQKLL